MEAYLGSLYSTRALTKKEEPNVCCDAQDKYIYLLTYIDDVSAGGFTCLVISPCA